MRFNNSTSNMAMDCFVAYFCVVSNGSSIPFSPDKGAEQKACGLSLYIQDYTLNLW